MRLAVVIACFNRKQLTLRIVDQVIRGTSEYQTSIYIVDGGSNDGTVGSLKDKFPSVDVQVQIGAHWNAAMRNGISRAMDEGFDFLLLLNDDLDLDLDAFRLFLSRANSSKIYETLVGKCIDPQTGCVTYGALKRKSRISKLHFTLLDNKDDVAITMNGNCVLIPEAIISKVGNLDRRFSHSFGDIDYGLRIKSAGYMISEFELPLGFSEYNKDWVSHNLKLHFGTWQKILCDPKGIPVREWLFFCYRHGGVIWPLNFFLRYFKLILNNFRFNKTFAQLDKNSIVR